jgi:hypothetical protein
MPNQQPVYFAEGEHETATAVPATKDTMLTAYFKWNAAHHTPYLYSEFPNHFVWKGGKWTPRKVRGDKILPRLYSVSPKDSEKYCLRILLHHIADATSFEYLRTVDGQTLPTFRGLHPSPGAA